MYVFQNNLYEQTADLAYGYSNLSEMDALVNTHSILDIRVISPTAEFAAAAPLTNVQLMEVFGTITPTRQIAENTDLPFAVSFVRARHQATYIIIYDEDKMPVELLFTGFTGT
jgi:hypothetical protein